MSRFVVKKGTTEVAYGYDPIPGGGYFIQVFDQILVNDENPEGVVLNEGFVQGISKEKMLALMTEYGVENPEHLKNVSLDLPI